MAAAVLIVPPLIKYSSGPLLGPAILKSAAVRNGHRCSVVDLNAFYITPRVSPRKIHGGFIGDHDKPGPGVKSLCEIERSFVSQYILPGLPFTAEPNASRRVHFGFLHNADLQYAACQMASSSFADWAKHHITGASEEVPDLVGISILHAGQVIPAAATSMLARQLWPDAVIVWGGPHISGIHKALLDDLQDRRFAADIFVTGHAERTFIEFLDKLARGESMKTSLVRLLEGSRESSVPPVFDNLDIYDEPLTLPAQSSLGCSYGKCAFCTYPVIEPVPSKLPLLSSVGSVADLAHSIGASIAIKDSLATSLRLKAIGACIDGRVPWSACTKLSRRLDKVTLSRLNKTGLATLEVGLESLLTVTQQRVGKLQPRSLYSDFLRDVSTVPDLSVIVNYMTGFPWEDKAEAFAGLREAEVLLRQQLGERGCIEHNTFELERLSPIANYPARYNVDINNFKAWPWASVLEDLRIE